MMTANGKERKREKKESWHGMAGWLAGGRAGWIVAAGHVSANDLITSSKALDLFIPSGKAGKWYSLLHSDPSFSHAFLCLSMPSDRSCTALARFASFSLPLQFSHTTPFFLFFFCS